MLRARFFQPKFDDVPIAVAVELRSVDMLLGKSGTRWLTTLVPIQHSGVYLARTTVVSIPQAGAGLAIVSFQQTGREFFAMARNNHQTHLPPFYPMRNSNISPKVASSSISDPI